MNEKAQGLRNLLIRNFTELELLHHERPPLYEARSARLSDGTAAKKLGAGIDIVPPGKRVCPYHLHHAQEEMFIVLEGEGTLRVAGEELPIRAGDVIHCPPGPEYPHQIINTSEAALKYLSISTQELPELCEYPDSGKMSGSTKDVRVRNRSDANLDYWDGEP